MSTYAVIMAGGSGTRFWPLSRAHRPKQLLALGPSEHSLLHETVRRIAPLVPASRVFIVTTAALAEAVRAAVPDVPGENVLAEPVGRNTAPCVGWAAVRIHALDPEATMVVLPADHYIEDETTFVSVLARAVEAAQGAALVTCGIEPTRPETGYGYIELAEAVSPGVRRCARFVEKPDLARAQAFVAGGHHLWNSGLFVFRAASILAEIRRCLPALAEDLDAVATALREGTDDAVIRDRYPRMTAVSIDHGVMEHAQEVLVVPGSFGWSDLGSFETAYELGRKSGDANVVEADAVLVDSTANFVRAPAEKLVALVGVHDLVVVDTGDALLIMPRSRSQDVKSVIAELEKRRDPRR